MKTNLSVRYINALRQLPQYACNTEHEGPLTHCMTGAQVLPVGDIADPADEDGFLEVRFLGGHKIEVYGHLYFEMALKEAAELEIATSPDSFSIGENKQSPIQIRIADLRDHLVRKHSLEA